MSDHIDGPRQIGDPSADLTDLFAFTSPENPGRTVLALDVFPSAGTSAMFSNAVNHAIVVRRVAVAGMGNAAKFVAGDEEIRFGCQFDMVERTPDAKLIQRGTFTFPDGQTLRFVANDEKGATTPDGLFRVFAGLRSDPFLLAWLLAADSLNKLPNLLLHDNVLSIVVEFDTRRVLEPDKGALFGAIAETAPVPGPHALVGYVPPRFDWVGRPEQTNVRLSNPGLTGADLRDLWNQQTPFAVAEDLKPVFRQRMIESLTNLDMRDGQQDWTPAELAASADVFLDDFLLFDVSKPITDTSFLEIEKSTLNNVPYQTGGGRTVDAHDVDILLTWLVNRDREYMQGGSTSATKPGTTTFPYLASPNTQLQTVVDRVDLAAAPDQAWSLIGPFDASWHPLIATCQLIGTGIGQLRKMETIDGKQIVERLESIDEAQMVYQYAMISGVPARDYTGTMTVTPKGTGSSVEWRVEYWADGQPDIIVRTIVGTLLKTGLESLKKRFG